MFQLSARFFLRFILKRKALFILQIATLAVAIASSLFVISFSIHEFGHDRFHTDANALFRVVEENLDEDHEGNRRSVKIPNEIYHRLNSITADTLITARVARLKGVTISAGSNHFSQLSVHAGDNKILQVFSVEQIAGSLERFSIDRRQAIISTFAAEMLFGNSDPVGRDLLFSTVNDTLKFSVTAVFHEFPPNTHEAVNILVPFDIPALEMLGFNTQATAIYARRLKETRLGETGQGFIHLLTAGNLRYSLQSLTEIYFGPRMDGEASKHGDSYCVIILILISGLMLVLAVSGYAILTALTLPSRLKEVAVRKLAGETNSSLFFSFFKESFVVVICALLIALVMIFSTDELSEVLSIDMVDFGTLRKGWAATMFASIVLLLTASPLVFSLRIVSWSPVKLLRAEKVSLFFSEKNIAAFLLGTCMFLIGTLLVISRQIKYSLLKEPGRNHQQIIYFTYPSELTSDALDFVSSGWRMEIPNIVDVSAVSHLPGYPGANQDNSLLYSILVDQRVLKVFPLKLIKGSWLPANNHDSLIVISKSGIDKASGQELSRVVGVIDDISRQYDLPETATMMKAGSALDYKLLCIRLLEVDVRATLDFLSAYFPEAEIRFIDHAFADWMRYQDRLNGLSRFLASLTAILSGCTIYTLLLVLRQEKRKQIAIRRICGASDMAITIFLVNKFARPALVAVVIFTPLAILFLQEFLRKFVYSTHLSWYDAVAPVAYCFLILVVLCHIRVASVDTNIVRSLKEK